MSIIDEIVQLEWQAMDKVHNEGGRASCQDDFATFSLMRASQFRAWDAGTLMCYYGDLREAARVGRNLVEEKYARMMASTAPEEYARFAHLLPPLDAARQRTIERIVAVQLAWRDAFAAGFPHLSAQARAIRSSEDTPVTTSFETYLRGELATYSPATLAAYAAMIDELEADERNLTTEIMAHTTRAYGYASLEAAEEAQARTA